MTLPRFPFSVARKCHKFLWTAATLRSKFSRKGRDQVGLVSAGAAWARAGVYYRNVPKQTACGRQKYPTEALSLAPPPCATDSPSYHRLDPNSFWSRSSPQAISCWHPVLQHPVVYQDQMFAKIQCSNFSATYQNLVDEVAWDIWQGMASQIRIWNAYCRKSKRYLDTVSTLKEETGKGGGHLWEKEWL